MEKKQTAVEWLASYIKGITDLNCDEIIEQAKQMEKEQMIKFSYKVLNESNDSITGYVDEEKIYNEIYGDDEDE
jgi:hypothetical protein